MASRYLHNKNWWIRYWERRARLRASFAHALASAPRSSSDNKNRHDHPELPDASSRSDNATSLFQENCECRLASEQ